MLVDGSQAIAWSTDGWVLSVFNWRLGFLQRSTDALTNTKQLGFKWGLVLIKVLVGLGNEATVGWLPFLSCRLLSFGSFTSFTRLFIARPKGLALGYSFASLSHKGFPIPSFTIVQSVIGLYLLNVHSLFVRSLLLLRVLTNTQCST